MAQMQLVHETETVLSRRRMRSSSVRMWAALTTGGIAAAATMALATAPAALADDPFYCFPPGQGQPWWTGCTDGATLDNGNTFHINKAGYKWETTPGGENIPILDDQPITLSAVPHGPIIVGPHTGTGPDTGTMPLMPDPMPDLTGCPPYCVPVMVPNPSGR
jgi:hypothetical protein